VNAQNFEMSDRQHPLTHSSGDFHLPEFRRTTIGLALVFWAVVLATDSVLWGIAGSSLGKSMTGKLVLTGLGALLAYGMSAVLRRLRNRSFLLKAGIGFCLAAFAAPIYAYADFEIFRWTVYPKPAPFEWLIFGTTLTSGIAMFFGWCCLYIALVYTYEAREREHRLAMVREEALAAQMQALRYQVNPHFLFNTLNSIAGLIEEGAASRAERMTISLSTFLRATLELDPLRDVPLEVELSLQEEYLGIERERFLDRMNFSITVPDEIRRAMVPNLILQPLIENALKHGVGRSSAPTDIRIAAWREQGTLWITVENDIGDLSATPASVGLGIGLKNVADRIYTRFGELGYFDAGVFGNGLFRAKVGLPLTFEDKWRGTEIHP